MVINPDLDHEYGLFSEGHRYVAGIDEAGRGALAGPVIAAAVMLPLDRFDLARVLSEVRDSKQLAPVVRLRCARQIRGIAVSVGVGEASAAEVDERGLLPATRAAMRRAVRMLDPSPTYLLIDHVKLPQERAAQEAITRGDQSVLSIAAASVIAKVWRDRLMAEIGVRYQGYGFEQHKGYGTAQHRLALAKLGPCPEHRRSYAPVKRVLSA